MKKIMYVLTSALMFILMLSFTPIRAIVVADVPITSQFFPDKVLEIIL